jgi:acetyl-CoA C-acetyltransferase
MATEALGLSSDDGRRLTATGGLPYFGGPGNNYTTHGIAEVTSALRTAGDSAMAGRGSRLAMATGLGWYVTKHAIGIYGSAPPPAGFRRADTSADQARIDDSAVEVVPEVDTATEATIVAVTVIREPSGQPTGSPAIVSLPDGRHMAVSPADDEVTAAMGGLDVADLVGTSVSVQPGAPRYRLAIS